MLAEWDIFDTALAHVFAGYDLYDTALARYLVAKDTGDLDDLDRNVSTV